MDGSGTGGFFGTSSILTQSMNLDTAGWPPLFRFGLSFDSSFGKKKYGKENQF
jgi:hypothetical protein